MQICQNCGTLNDDTANICQCCRMKGHFKKQDEASPKLPENSNEQTPHQAYCLNCGQPTMPHDTKCPYCRMPLRVSSKYDLLSNSGSNGLDKLLSFGKKMNHSFSN